MTSLSPSTAFAQQRAPFLEPVELNDLPLKPEIIKITEAERKSIFNLALQLKDAFGTYEDLSFISQIHVYAYQLLPERLVRYLCTMGQDFSDSQYGAVILQNLIEVDQNKLGPTPPNWKQVDPEKISVYGFICALLHGAVPSKPVQYYAQRKGGGLLHAIIPDEKMTYSQTGSGSRTELLVHTEDAFLYHAADFLSFLYLRNEEQVNSMLYSIRSHGPLKAYMKRLFEPLFTCPKDANFDSEIAVGDRPLAPILYGNTETPFIRFDVAEQLFNPHAGQSAEAIDLLKRFWNEARALVYSDYIPQAGDLIFVNNHLCAHGRTAFKAGIRYENGVAVACERRQMLRMMSKTSLLSIREATRTNDPYFIMEEHYGKVTPETTQANG